jgi:alpha-beta hydrolase superfamily lysophospholipase
MCPVRVSQVVLPFLILHAEEDKFCDVEGSRLMHKKAKSKDKQLITFPNAGHNLVTVLSRCAQRTSSAWVYVMIL